MSAALHFDLSELEAVNARIGALATLDKRSLMDAIGFVVENQTRDRISEHGPDPEGNEWQKWSDEYAKHRPDKGGLLELTGELRDTLTYAVDIDGEGVEIGSNLVYAAIQQLGGKSGMAPGPAAIPARPYLGLSDENRSEVESVVVHWLDEQIHGAPA